MSKSILTELAGANGAFAGNTTGTRVVNFVGVFIPNACTISVLLNKDGEDVTDTYIWDKSASIEGNTYIRANGIDEYFTSITNTAGAFNLNFNE